MSPHTQLCRTNNRTHCHPHIDSRTQRSQACHTRETLRHLGAMCPCCPHSDLLHLPIHPPRNSGTARRFTAIRGIRFLYLSHTQTRPTFHRSSHPADLTSSHY